MHTKNNQNLTPKLPLFILLALFHEVHVYPVYSYFHPGSRSRAELMCAKGVINESKMVLNCWVTPEMYEMYTARSDLLQEEVLDSRARFNIHLYLDHMWHFNVGFS
ncbi:unnamed protein product [Orchesella dallaii]|uniref:Uncharacterized protein n=1 Tax=Orchesella dallaii TaxID=48710 RepID=A0ABP1QQG5_9HEXA